MDLDAISMGLYDDEVRLLLKTEKMLHVSHFVYVCLLRALIYNP